MIGQRWISHTEPELGLGLVSDIEHRRITISFPAVGEQRVYAANNAPLGRIKYKVGAQIRNFDNEQFIIEDIHEQEGLVFYAVKNEHQETVLPELELDCFVQFDGPKERLLAGQIDPYKFFQLRQETLEHWHRYQQSNVKGLLGPRVQLLPHQLYIAQQVAQRQFPRVLLADEVGLGKTIEAGLIIHQQLLTGRAQRVLIVLPDSLVHQWLVEMRRRFNLAFSVLNTQMCEDAFDPETNPFEMTQLVITPLSFLLEEDERFMQAMDCEWDLLIVDEAHHLQWTEEEASEEYECVESLAMHAGGVLLLTATPEQLGREGHFARLRLLDPDRYHDLQSFVAEEHDYAQLMPLIDELIALESRALNDIELPENLADFLETNEMQLIENFVQEGDVVAAIEYALNALLDRHGTGRVLFRNTRASVSGFPQRQLNTYPLSLENLDTDTFALTSGVKEQLQIEQCFNSAENNNWLAHDKRVPWLLDWLKDNPYEQVLLICASARTAIVLEEYLRVKQAIRSSVFHEGMSLIERDRAAAYFADSENAAQILLCSEIGSEGRNFQFARNIILFDLPINPDLLEQRIGRLDRIGQQNDVQIHVPFYENTAQEKLLQWYHLGLNAFEKSCAIGVTVLKKFEHDLLTCLSNNDDKAFDALLEATQEYTQNLNADLQAGRDRLLELNSCRPMVAERVVDDVIVAEQRKVLENYMSKACDQMGIDVEPYNAQAVVLRPTDQMRCGLLPGLNEDGVTLTYAREEALSREDFGFLTWENPTVLALMESILSSDHGNSMFATLKIKALKEGALLLEVYFSLQSQAPAALGLQQYFPDSHVRVLVNIDGKDLANALQEEGLAKLLKSVPMQAARNVIKNTQSQIETLYQHATKAANQSLEALRQQTLSNMREQQQAELLRLQALAKVNKNIRQQEIDAQEQYMQVQEEYIQQLNLKADAVRLIMTV